MAKESSDAVGEGGKNRKHFDAVRAQLNAAKDAAAATSNRIGSGRFPEPRFGWATWNLTLRMIFAANSTQLLLRAYVDLRVHSGFDHVSVVVLCRSIVEQEFMLAYLAESGISKDEWDLRKWTLDIHDCNTRIQLFRSLGDSEQKRGFQKQLEELKDRMRGSVAFQALEEKVREEILAGMNSSFAGHAQLPERPGGATRSLTGFMRTYRRRYTHLLSASIASTTTRSTTSRSRPTSFRPLRSRLAWPVFRWRGPQRRCWTCSPMYASLAKRRDEAWPGSVHDTDGVEREARASVHL